MPGLTESCVSGAHSECHTSDCICPCHQRNRKPNPQPQANIKAPIIEAVCPKCGSKTTGANYCRMDGSKLIRGKQCLDCNAVLNQADAYCYMCGQQAGKKRDRDLEQKRLDGTLDEGEVSVK